MRNTSHRCVQKDLSNSTETLRNQWSHKTSETVFCIATCIACASWVKTSSWYSGNLFANAAIHDVIAGATFSEDFIDTIVKR